MVQPTRIQGLIWQTVLKSQKISVIWEAPDVDLVENLTQIKHAGLNLPDLLLIDVRLKNFNPYAFCRWCREQCPEMKVVLVNASQKEISPSERQWAIYQGASDLLPGFQRENLVSSVAAGVRRVLDVMDGPILDNGALIAALLMIKRELDSRQAAPKPESGLPLNPSATPNKANLNHMSPFSMSAGVDGEVSNGRSRNGASGDVPEESEWDTWSSASSDKPATKFNSSAKPVPKPEQPKPETPPDGDEPPPRKYRGMSY